YRPSLDPAVKRQTDILTQPSDTGSLFHDQDEPDGAHHDHNRHNHPPTAAAAATVATSRWTR
ncbi:hypothetical protein CSPAE12_02748, partial [Colletotrichum incanum]